MTMVATRTRDFPGGGQRRRSRSGSLFREIFAGIVMLTGLAACGSLAYALFQGVGPAPTAPAPEAPLEQPWAEIAHPMQLYALQSPEFGKEPRGYEARRHRTGGGRQDVLTYGADFGLGPTLRLSLYRVGAEETTLPTLFVEIARQAAQAGLSVTRSALPAPLASKFGTFESTDVVLSQNERSASCIAFRLNAGDANLRLSGFVCGGESAPDRAALTCILDRLDLVAAGDDAPLLRFFTAAEQARGKTCPTTRPAGTRTTWLDPAGKAPALRNVRQAGRITP